MPRSFDLTAESPNAADLIHTTFRDETYWWARLSKFNDGNPTLDSLVTDAHGITVVTITINLGVEQLPSPVNRLHRGTLRVHHVESWHAADDGVLHGTVSVDAPGTPMSGGGKLSITPTSDGSRLAGNGTVDVRLPVIGGAVAGFIAHQLATGIRDIHAFTDAWIAANGST